MVTMAITKSVSIACSPEAVFEFLADPRNWPQWATVNVQSVQPLEGEWWPVHTPLGPGKLRIQARPETGVLDHEFLAGETCWSVAARVVSNRLGAEYITTFFKPEAMPEEAFIEQVDQVDGELARLKQVLERRQQAAA